MGRASRVAFAAALSLSSCKSEINVAPVADLAAGVAPFVPPQSASPLPQSKLPTTDGKIALSNLEGDIENLKKMIEKDPHRHAAMVRLASVYLLHGQVVGKLAEYDLAIALVERAAKELPKDWQVWATHAEVRARLHRFDEARASLARAEKLGAPAKVVDPLRASLAQALGKFDEARPIRDRAVAKWANFETLSAQAGLASDEGRTDEAERLYIQAQNQFGDVAAYPIAWLYFQEGLLWERAGRLPRARELYQASVDRLPGYAPAIAHLAGVEAASGSRDQAIRLLTPLVESADDPEYQGQLSSLLRDSGKTAEADRLRALARAGYDDLLKRHPEAFADHAARFYLDAGADPARALALAKDNLKLRQTGEAYQLTVEAALAANVPAVACDAAEHALALCHAPAARSPRDGGQPSATCTAHRHVLASRAFSACGRADRAAEELRAAGGG